MAQRLIIVRAGHVIAADGTDQLAAARLQALRADGTKPRRIFRTSGGGLARWRRRSGSNCGLRTIGPILDQLPLRGAFHGWKFIAQGEEERTGKGLSEQELVHGGDSRDRGERGRAGNARGRIETNMEFGASFYVAKRFLAMGSEGRAFR
jgi:hypothetical protein